MNNECYITSSIEIELLITITIIIIHVEKHVAIEGA